MRLDKLLSHEGYGSRKEVKNLIRKGYVLVNGLVVTDDDFVINEEIDEVTIFDNNIDYQEFFYYMLNKPYGYVSATYDYHKPYVTQIFSDLGNHHLFPVGRLDIDTTGLLLVTNDGALAHKLLSPKYHVNKKYYVRYTGVLNPNYETLMHDGLILEDGFKCKPASLEVIDSDSCYVNICEGKFHQVKRMMMALGTEVTELVRIEFGSLKLDPTLREGEYRKVTEEELFSLKGLEE